MVYVLYVHKLGGGPRVDRMKKHCLAVALLFTLGMQACAGNQTNATRPDSLSTPAAELRTDMKAYYVAPQGNDNAPGTQAAPFATVERARNAIRAWKTEPTSSGKSAVVYLREGVYRQTGKITFSAEDSGSESAPIIYKAYPGERARIIGGLVVPLSKFIPITNPVVKDRLPLAAQNKVVTIDLKKHAPDAHFSPPGLGGFGMQLLAEKTNYKTGPRGSEVFMNGTPGTLARWPNTDYAKVGKVVEKGDIVRDWMDDSKETPKYVAPQNRNNPPKGFAFTGDKAVFARWAKATDIMMYGYWWLNWADQTVQVASVDPELGVIRSVQPSAYGLRTGQRYYVFNLLEELDSPGEWYMDERNGVLYIYPPAVTAQGDVEISLLDQPLIQLNGASYLTFDGLELGVTKGVIFEVINGKSNLITRCKLGKTAKQAIVITGGEANRVSRNTIDCTGAGGVSVSGGDLNTLKPSAHLVDNNTIRNYARLERVYRPAIKLGGVGQIARNNEISDSPHFAISFSGNNHLIELNYIHNVCQESDDASAIYCGRSWTSRGTTIRHNLLRDIQGYKAGTHRVSGIYLDDGWSGTTIEGNILLNVAQGLMLNGGRDNRVENNLFINNENTMRGTDMSKSFKTWAAPSWYSLNKNLAQAPIQRDEWKQAYPTLVSLASDEPQFPKNNTVINNLRFNSPLVLRDTGVNFATQDVADSNQKGIEANFIQFGRVENNPESTASPGDFDEATGRFVFTTSPEGAALMPNILSIPVEKIGIVGAAATE